MRVPERTRRGPAAAFTLIELLVVIAIIAVLVSLTSAAVMRVLDHGPRVETRTEIGQMEVGLVNAMQEMAGDPGLAPPSRLVLRERNDYSAANPDHQATVAFLTKMFGKHACDPLSGGAFIDWNGNGTADAGDLVLQGPQCLTFILGGIPSAGGPTGFSKNKTNPAAAGGARYGPYYEFKPARLARGANGFYVYYDSYQKAPYLFFSSNGTNSTYNDPATQAASDCPASVPALGGGTLNLPFVKPYRSGTQYIKSRGFQIISAGKDGKFGLGGTTWNPANGYGSGNDGSDDMANFSKSPLGSPSE